MLRSVNGQKAKMKNQTQNVHTKKDFTTKDKKNKS